MIICWDGGSSVFNGIDQLSCVYCYQIWYVHVFACACVLEYALLLLLMLLIVLHLWSVKWPNLIRRDEEKKALYLIGLWNINVDIFFTIFPRYIFFVCFYFSECIIFSSLSFAEEKNPWDLLKTKNYRSRTTKSHYKTFNNCLSPSRSLSLSLPLCLPEFSRECVHVLQVYAFYIFRIFFRFVRQNESGIVLICIHQIEQLHRIFRWVSFLFGFVILPRSVCTIQFLISIFAV